MTSIIVTTLNDELMILRMSVAPWQITLAGRSLTFVKRQIMMCLEFTCLSLYGQDIWQKIVDRFLWNLGERICLGIGDKQLDFEYPVVPKFGLGVLCGENRTLWQVLWTVAHDARFTLCRTNGLVIRSSPRRWPSRLELRCVRPSVRPSVRPQKVFPISI